MGICSTFPSSFPHLLTLIRECGKEGKMCSSHIVNEGISIDMGIDPGLWGWGNDVVSKIPIRDMIFSLEVYVKLQMVFTVWPSKFIYWIYWITFEIGKSNAQIKFRQVFKRKWKMHIRSRYASCMICMNVYHCEQKQFDCIMFLITNNANKLSGRPFMLLCIQHASPKNKEAQHLLLLFLQQNSMLYLNSPTSTLSATYASLPKTGWVYKVTCTHHCTMSISIKHTKVNRFKFHYHMYSTTSKMKHWKLATRRRKT